MQMVWRARLPEQIIELELRDLCSQLQEFNVPAETAAPAFEHLHYVEESISKSVVAPELPASAESTL